MIMNKIAFSPDIQGLLEKIKDVTHFLTEDGQPAISKIAEEVLQFATYVAKAFEQSDSLLFLENLVDLGRIHDKNMDVKGSRIKPYAHLLDVVLIIKGIAAWAKPKNITELEDILQYYWIPNTDTPKPSHTDVEKALPALTVYTDKSCRDALLLLDKTVKENANKLGHIRNLKVIEDIQENPTLIENISKSAKHFHEMYLATGGQALRSIVSSEKVIQQFTLKFC